MAVGNIAGCEDHSHPEGRASDRSYLDELNERLSNMSVSSSQFFGHRSGRLPKAFFKLECFMTMPDDGY